MTHVFSQQKVTWQVIAAKSYQCEVIAVYQMYICSEQSPAHGSIW